MGKSYIDYIQYNRDWTQSEFRNILINLMSTEFAYENIDKVDDILVSIFHDFKNLTLPNSYDQNLMLLRQLVFIEGIDFLFRALNFAQAIQKLMLDGFYTPAQSMSYQASFFCARSILGISGIYCSSIENKNFMLEMYSLESGNLDSYTIIKTGRDHIMIWNLLRRILSYTILNESIIAPKTFKIISNIKYHNCTKLRHDIHYYNKYQFKDLLSQNKISIKPIEKISLNDLENDCDYFDILCLLLLLSSRLFLTIAKYSSGLNNMYDIFSSLTRVDNNPIFAQNNLLDRINEGV